MPLDFDCHPYLRRCVKGEYEFSRRRKASDVIVRYLSLVSVLVLVLIVSSVDVLSSA